MRKSNTSNKRRVYVCHTFYQVYVAVLKEMYAQKSSPTRGVMLLSPMSMGYGSLQSRLEKEDLFDTVMELNEVHPRFFEEPYPRPLGTGGWLRKLWERRQYYRYVVKNEEKHINFDFRKTDEIYVFCDSDPIGSYLNMCHIPYIAVEDGRNSATANGVVAANEQFFWLKRFLAKRNFLFMPEGYSKYCRFYEVNSADGVISTGRKIRVVPNDQLIAALNDTEKEKIYRMFKSWDSSFAQKSDRFVMILTQPVCTEENRIRMYQKMIDMYRDQSKIMIKPHPKDKVDYQTLFPDCLVIDSGFPIEIFNIHCDFICDKIVTAYSTSLDALTFAKEKISLGVDFLDEFEPPEMHSDLKKYWTTK